MPKKSQRRPARRLADEVALIVDGASGVGRATTPRTNVADEGDIAAALHALEGLGWASKGKPAVVRKLESKG